MRCIIVWRVDRSVFSGAKTGLKINSIFDITFEGGYFSGNTNYDIYANPAVRISNVSIEGTVFDPGPTIAKIYLFTANPVQFNNVQLEGNDTIPAILSDIAVIS